MPPTNQVQNQNIVYNYSPVTNNSFWKKKSTKVGMVVFGLVVIILIILLAITKQPTTVAQDFITDAIMGKTSQSYKLTDASFKSTTSLTAWGFDVESIETECQGKLSLVSDTSKTNTVQVILTSSSTNNQTCKFVTSLYKTSSGWQVEGLSYTD